MRINNFSWTKENKRYSNESSSVKRKSNEINMKEENEAIVLIFKIIENNLVYFSGIEETLYKVYNKIFQYNCCALSKIIRSKTCFQIWNYICFGSFNCKKIQ